MTKSEAFLFLDRMARGIALIFGESCETIIHDFSDGMMTNIAIYNGSVSGRNVGSHNGILDSSLVDTNQIQKIGTHDIVNQLVHLKNGRTVKSSTFFLTGEDYILALGINYEITLMTQMEQFLSSITSHSGDLFSTMSEDKGNDADLLVQIFDQALSRIGVSVSDMNKQDRFSLVALLKEQDYFRLQKSVRYVAEQLNVSKYTIYKYLKELDADV
ncbi:transcriptional regulator [Mediterraneibacter glycyrrhizinilyticus]|uniref:helix-turn-helix transcriptional regulator n=1 Tax=Mediterraneibacter glycyrrhizinilyticus TaxID=342942 RepID=UPI001960088F|nr:helix-turn-helix transcriptional regulator [Mediterraneibacter glycyrrhizinilyticus]MBM6750109.1 transcriptional regulator [Mediterraneibacter glycyrrhizinilyticus]